MLNVFLVLAIAIALVSARGFNMQHAHTTFQIPQRTTYYADDLNGPRADNTRRGGRTSYYADDLSGPRADNTRGGRTTYYADDDEYYCVGMFCPRGDDLSGPRADNTRGSRTTYYADDFRGPRADNTRRGGRTTYYADDDEVEAWKPIYATGLKPVEGRLSMDDDFRGPRADNTRRGGRTTYYADDDEYYCVGMFCPRGDDLSGPRADNTRRGGRTTYYADDDEVEAWKPIYARGLKPVEGRFSMDDDFGRPLSGISRFDDDLSDFVCLAFNCPRGDDDFNGPRADNRGRSRGNTAFADDDDECEAERHAYHECQFNQQFEDIECELREECQS